MLRATLARARGLTGRRRSGDNRIGSNPGSTGDQGEPKTVYAVGGMPGGSAVRNRSHLVTVATPHGEVEVARQEMGSVRRGSSWSWFWVARRKGRGAWSEATTAREAIRKATLLPPRKLPAWLNAVAADAENQVTHPDATQPLS